jgi:hypothetical protein
MGFPNESLSGRGRHDTIEHAANAVLTEHELYTNHSNNAATGVVTLTLPASQPGMWAYFGVREAFELRIDPFGTETISLPTTGVPGAAGKYLSADAIGESIHLRCFEAGSWAVVGFTGTWTAEA